ncbi:MAG: hypothetical protein GY832_20160 [Chloroflexi bacterium]|nr:hypothetical protein [Chloroflexota bacterium]
MSQQTNFVYEAGTNDRPVAYQGKATKTGKSIAWQIGEFGGNYAEARPVNIFTSVKTHALRSGAFSLRENTPFTRQDGSKSYPQAFLASQIQGKMALKSRDKEYEVWAVPGLAVRGEGFEEWLNIPDEVMVGRGVGKRDAAFELADRVAKALTKSVFINVPKLVADAKAAIEEQETDTNTNTDDTAGLSDIPF